MNFAFDRLRMDVTYDGLRRNFASIAKCEVIDE